MSRTSFDKRSKSAKAVDADPMAHSPVKAAVLYIALWELAAVLLWLFSAKLFVIYPLFAVGFTVIYPVCTWWACYRHAKLYGIKRYVAPVMIILSVAEFIFVKEARSVVPNFIVLTILSAGFAAGIGSCFADKDAINAAEEDKKRKKHREEAEYKNILDD